jgi:hypothetical protein
LTSIAFLGTSFLMMPLRRKLTRFSKIG